MTEFIIELPFEDADADAGTIAAGGGTNSNRRVVHLSENDIKFVTSVFRENEVRPEFDQRLLKNGIEGGEDREGGADREGLFGDSGLLLSMSSSGALGVSVEAATILYLTSTSDLWKTKGSNKDESILQSLHGVDGTYFCVFRNGIRGVVAENRFWEAIYYHLKDLKDLKILQVKEPPRYKDPQRPTLLKHVRSWYPKALVQDFIHLVEEETVLNILRVIASKGFEGAPDVVCWSTSGEVKLVEVKSSKDKLSDKQEKLLTNLIDVENEWVRVHVAVAKNMGPTKVENINLLKRKREDTDDEN